MEKIRINVCTTNDHKYRELAAIFGEQFELVKKPVEVTEIQGGSREILERKMADAYAALKEPLFVEDVSLSFKALNGLPGPYIKDFLKAIGERGLHRILKDYEDKSATALCSIGYTDGKTTKIFEGSVKGKIVEPRGTHAFGWDGAFEVEEVGLTFGEMTDEEKNKLSHRFRAAVKLKEYLLEAHRK